MPYSRAYQGWLNRNQANFRSIISCIEILLYIFSGMGDTGLAIQGFSKLSKHGNQIKILLGDERAEGAQACSGTEWHRVGQQRGRGGVDFSDETCFRLVCEIVTESTRSRHDVFTRFVRLRADRSWRKKYCHSTYLATTDCTCHLQMQDNNIRFSDDLSAWSRPQRCQLAGGGTLLEPQLRPYESTPSDIIEQISRPFYRSDWSIILCIKVDKSRKKKRFPSYYYAT